jgi:outer membrane protein OmpA-like peptidoglycan-associated protein
MITGYTDRMGDRVYNIRLAERRVTLVARALGTLGRATINPVGSDVLPHDNTYPEGRFYSRTIEIELAH